MIIDLRWFNFEFGVLSHLKLVSLKPIANTKEHANTRHTITMVAPSSDQWQETLAYLVHSYDGAI